MPPKASGSSSAASGAHQQPAAATTAGGAVVASAELQPQPQPQPQPESFIEEKLRWARAVPPDQRPPSMQRIIDSCECTIEATRLLEAAPLEQLSGPSKLRALLLLLKSYFCFGGQSPYVPGIRLHGVGRQAEVAEQALQNKQALLSQASGPMGGWLKLNWRSQGKLQFSLPCSVRSCHHCVPHDAPSLSPALPQGSPYLPVSRTTQRLTRSCSRSTQWRLQLPNPSS